MLGRVNLVIAPGLQPPMEPIDIEIFKKGVSDSITSRYAKLSSTLEGSMEPFSRHMFEAGFINLTTIRSQNYDDIMSQFISGMEFKHNISELQEHCRLFTDILEKLDGSAKMAANEFIKEWNTLFHKKSI